MSERVEISLAVDTSNANAEIDAVAAKAETVVKDWHLQRRLIISELQQTVSTISRMIGMARQVLSIFGAAIPPFYSALISMVMSTVATLLSIAGALATTGVGIPASVAISVVAIGINAVLIAQLIKDQQETERYSQASLRRINQSARTYASYSSYSPFGVGF